MLFTAKTLAIVFALATTGFCASTIVLAVQKADLLDELQEAMDKLDTFITTTSTIATHSTIPSTNIPVSSDLPYTDDSSEGATTVSTSDQPEHNSTITTPPQNPNFPTLPPGLPDANKILYRLPIEIRPIRYRLYLFPDHNAGKCEGTVSIQFELYAPTNLIVMHAKDLEIENISILQMMARMRLRIKEYYTDKERELLIIELKEVLYVGLAYVVSISFTSNISGLLGIYASSYDDEREKRWIATTKFEPTYARQAFPCFDEPSLKAVFDITIVRPTGYTALSNMNVESETTNGELTEVHFHETVPMSTYLVCFIVSDFVSKSSTVRGTLEGAHDFEMRVFTTPSQLQKADFALENGVNITEYYIDYFNIPYPLPKLDMAAIPDYVSGATEHWGLITYRETSLLYDPQISATSNKQRVAVVVAHELAHMWFGNLVTMKWWNDLWLSEGFATFMAYKGVNNAQPTWAMLDQFLIADLHPVLQFDATLASHPIVQTVNSPSEITELFDKISYSKGASIIRMLEDFVGEDKFRNATTKYLNRYFFDNADTDDFLTKIEEEGFDFDVKLFMQTWINQMGFPVVQVTKKGNTYHLTQKRFFSNPEDYNNTFNDSNFNYRWSIPITYTTSVNSEIERIFFNYNDNDASVTVSSEVDWIKFNINQTGYYRVNYEADIWLQLITAVRNTRGVLSASDRANLIDDVVALADASQLQYHIALDLLSYLENEIDYIPWSVASSRLLSIEQNLFYTEFYSVYATFARNLLGKAYELVTWNVGSDHVFNLLRVTILDSACHFGLEDALNQAATQFDAWLANPAIRPNPDIRSTVYYYGMEVNGNEKFWNLVWDLFISEADAQEKLKLMRSLSAIKEPWILQRYINLAWNQSYVRSQDYFTCLQYISENRIGESLVWDYVRENWSNLVERFGINDRSLGLLIPQITKRFSTRTKEEEMQSFFAKYPEGGAGTFSRKVALENVKYNINWLKENNEEVGNWLNDNFASHDTKSSQIEGQ